MSFKASISLLIFSLDDLPIDESEVLKFPAFVTIIVLLFISSLMAVSICLIYCNAPLLDAYIFTIAISPPYINPLIII